MKFKRLFIMLTATAALTIGKARAQQNIQFTQYIFNSLSVNPAYAGYKEEWFLQLSLRSQWTDIEGAPKTGQLSIDGITDPTHKRMGIGLQVTADKVGPQSATSVYGNYAYRLRLNDEDTERLSFGVGAGFTQYTLDGGVLAPSPDGQIDPSLPTGKISNFIPDVRFGVYYHNPKWYVGASVMDLLSGDQSNNIFRWDANTTENLKRKRHMYIIAGMLFDLDTDIKLRPSILLKEDFKGPTSLDINALFIFGNRFWIGGGYRTGVTLWDKDYRAGQQLSRLNSFSAIAQFYVHDRLRIGYSYDYMLGRLGNMQNGTHEITVGLTFPRKGQRLLSPRFF